MPQNAFVAADKRAFALAERARLHKTLAGLSDAQWATPSLCEGWTVREVAGHVAENTRASMGSFLVGMAGTRFDHDEYNKKAAAKWAQRSTDELVEALNTDRMMQVFKMSPSLLMVDNVVHHQDIRRPLSLGTDFPEEHLAATLTAIMTEGAFSGEAKRYSGKRIVATDIDWQHGEGSEELSGPAESLIMTIMGRSVGAEEVRSA